MTAYWQAVRAFSPSMRRFLWAIGIAAVMPFAVMPVLLNLYLLRLGFDAGFIGLLAGVGQIAWAATALPAGLLSNRIGLRPSLQLGLGLMGLGLALMLLVEGIPHAQWQAWLLGGQIVLFVSFALITVNVPPYVMAVTAERERRHAFAVLASLIPTAAFVGSLVAGMLPGVFARQLGWSLDAPEPYRLALWLGPIVAWIGVLPLFGADLGKIEGRALHLDGDGRAPLRLLAFWGVVVLWAAIGEGAVRTFYNVYLDRGLGVPPAAIGTIMGVAQLLPIAMALAMPLLIARWGTAYTFAGGSVALIGQVWMAALAYMGCIVALTVIGTSRDMMGQEIVIARWRTSSQAVAMIGLSLGGAIAGLLGGMLIDARGFAALFLVSAATSVIAAALLAGYVRLRRAMPQAAVAAAVAQAEVQPMVETLPAAAIPATAMTLPSDRGA